MIGIGEIIVRNRMMMEQMRLKAVGTTYRRFCEAAREYYQKGYDSGELAVLVRELYELGADPEELLETELDIREEVGEYNRKRI